MIERLTITEVERVRGYYESDEIWWGCEWFRDLCIRKGVSIQDVLEITGCEVYQARYLVRSLKLWRERGYLVRRHIDEGLSSGEIARLVGVGEATVDRWLKKSGVREVLSPSEVGELSRQRKFDEYKDELWYDEGWVREQYIDKGVPVSDMVKEAGCSRGTIFRALERCGIGRRTAERELELVLESEGVLWRDEGWMRGKYLGEGLSTKEVAEEAGCSPGTVSKWLKKFGISLRSSTLIDEVGNKYGELVIIRRAGTNNSGEATWLCKCSCGNEVIVRGASLRRGNRKSCGCLSKLDLSDKRYGQLVAIKPTKGRKNGSQVIWPCRCDCGNQVLVSTGSWGSKENCGCKPVISGNVIDETGNVYGRLTVLEYVGNSDWRCKCSCGKKKVIRGRSLRTGETKSCGCLRREVTGRRVKRLREEGHYDGVFQSPASIEIETADAMDELGLEYDQEYRPDGYSRPFDFLVGDNVLVEVQGDYWHTLPGARGRDAEKACWAKNNGYKIVEIWEHEINDLGGLKIVEERVLPLLD